MRRPLLWLALVCHVALAAGYAWLTPSFEGPDENSHYEYAWQIANARRLPLTPALAAARDLPQTEGAVLAHHPPLYYMLLAAGLRFTHTDDTVFGPVPNPEFGREGAPGRNLCFLHGGDENAPVDRGRRVLLGLRCVSVLLGLASILCVHRLARLSCPAQPVVADVAALLVSCLPMWSFMHGVLNNDNLATLLATATLAVLAGLLRGVPFSTGRAVLLGLLLGAAALTKLTTLFLLGMTVVAFAVLLLRGSARERARVLMSAVVAAVITLAVSGWVFWRNMDLYGDPLALSAHDAAFAVRHVPDELASQWMLHGFLPQIFTSLLGTFGWFQLQPAAVLVVAGAAVAGAALAGLAALLPARTRERLPRPIWFLALACGLVFAGAAHFNRTAMQPQARLLFPAVGPAAVLLAAGLVRIGELLRLTRVALPFAAVPPAVGAAVLLLWFRPAFDPELARGPDTYAATAGDIVDRGRTKRATAMTWQEPRPASPMTSPPTLRWTAPADDDGDAVYSLYAYDAPGRVWLATYEWSRVAIRGGSVTMADAAFRFLPTDRDVFLVLRRVPDWRRGERVADMPRTPPLRVRRG